MSKKITAARRDWLLEMARHEYVKKLQRERNHWLKLGMMQAAEMTLEDIRDFEQVFDEITQFPEED